MKKYLSLMAMILLVMVLLTACVSNSTVVNGTVVNKTVIPAYVEDVTVYGTMRIKNLDYAIPYEITASYPEKYMISVYEYQDNGEVIMADVYVSKEIYDNIEIGDNYRFQPFKDSSTIYIKRY